ncbi:carbohydrate ABC transporter permease [Paenibacillus senegalimassiliensis]|uniref:carbohydrate ABC transporter permease n=1 Tax=Paenibacillus senegalimassiliensis TaxID=1737426 RepID=UPI00073F75D2|nr:sugar ABC transporter permease [Paenibacillus senegalimassiliensis]
MKLKGPNMFYFLILLPALLLFTIFFIIPVVQSLALSFTDAYGMRPNYKFIGLDNYIAAFKDRSFIDTISATLKFTITAVILGNVVSLILALLLDTKIRARSFLRSIFFIPNVMSLLVVGYVWSFVYSDALPDLFAALQLPASWQASILGNPDIVIYALAVTAVWNVAGYYMIIYLAALQGISEDLMEAAKIDGARTSDILFKIKLPLISPIIVMCLILSTAAHIKIFELPFTMTSGGPAGSSMTMVLKIYNTAFSANQTGLATAQSTIFFLLIAGITLILTRLMKSREEKI